MFHINVWLTVKDPANVATVRGLIPELVRLSRSEPGCVRYDVFHSEADPRKFLLAECWAQKSDWETHRSARSFTEIYSPKVIPLVDREPHISTLIE